MSTSRTRILYIIGSLAIGGAEGHVVQVIRNLDRSRFEPHLLCLTEIGPLEAPLREVGVPIHCLSLKGLRDHPPHQVVALMVRGWREIRRIRPDIVHTYLYWANLIGGVLGRLAGTKALITSRRSLGIFKDARWFFQPAEDLLNLFSHAVTVNSMAVQQDVLLRERIAPHKLHLIYNGVEWQRFADSPSEGRLGAIRTELHVPETATVVGCVANLIHYKGHDDLLAAMAPLMLERQTLHLVLIGRDGGVQDALERRAHQLGVRERIHFAGSRRNIAEVLHLMDVQVLPSHEEGFSNAILEGMAAARPMVVTAVGGNAEAVIDGETGLVVPPRQPGELSAAIARLVDNPEEARRMGQLGQERVKREFSVERMMEQLQMLYAQVLDKRGSNRTADLRSGTR